MKKHYTINNQLLAKIKVLQKTLLQNQTNHRYSAFHISSFPSSIRMSDSQNSDQFQQFDEIEIESSISPDMLNPYNPKNKDKQPPVKKKKEKIFQVEIIESQNKIDMNFLENQFYLLKLSKKDQIIKNNVQRRYSDFDLLFQILEKKYPGFVFPAFPEKGILSYVKTKVSVTKDEQFLRKRVKIIERFFNYILNEEKFNPQKCNEIAKFFSKDEEYQIFKKINRQEISKTKSIVDSTWGVIKDFFKMSQNNKYTAISEEIKKQKVPFEELLSKTQDLLSLIDDEFEANQVLDDYESENRAKCAKFIPNFSNLVEKVKNYEHQMKPVKRILSEIGLQLQCENDDYLMILKKIEFIEQLRESEQNYKNFSTVETEFMNRRHQIQEQKKESLQRLKNRFKEIVNEVNKIERDE